MTFAPEGSPTLITSERACVECGYDLRGLYTSASCPECGTPIQRRGGLRRFADNLVDAPLSYLRRMWLGTMMVAVGALVATLGVGIVLVYRLPGLALLGTLGVAVYAGGAWIVTARRPRDSDRVPDALLDSPWVRWLVRGTQTCWPAALGIGVVLPLVSGPAWIGSAAGLAGTGLAFIGFIGLLPFGIYLSALAQWAGETSLADRFRNAGVLTGGLGILSLVLDVVARTPTLLATPASFLGFLTGLLSLVGLLMFIVSLVQTASMCGWAIRNWNDVRERDQRVEERREKHNREMVERIANQPAVPVTQSGPLHATAAEHRLDRVEDSSPLELVGDEPADPDEPCADRPVVHARSEDVRPRDDDTTPYGLEPDTRE